MATKGIILIAIGDPYYGKMAFNLAVTLKANEPVSISLIHDNEGIGHLSQSQQKWFDNLLPLPSRFDYVGSKREILRPKTLLNVLSPYDETIYIDSDTIWNPTRRVQNIFDELSGVHFTIANRGYTKQETGMAGFSLWAPIEEIRKEHGIDSYLDVSSEFIYFKRGAISEEIFSTAANIFETDPVSYRYFAGGKPDEPAFAIALSKLGHEPHKVPFYPSWWYYHDKSRFPSRSEICNNYWFFSFGGNQVNKYQKKLYTDVTSDVFHRTGAGIPFPLLEKNKVLKERASY